MDRGYAKVVGSKHLKMDLYQEAVKPISAIAFQQGEQYRLIEKQIPFNICYHVEVNEWNGSVSLQLNVKDIKFSD